MPCKNMKKPSAFVLILSFLLLVLLPTCNNSVDDMLENYNGGFKKGYVTVGDNDESEYTLEPDDSGYDQNRLLFEEYTVYDIGTLNLAAPQSCTNFNWFITDPDGDDSLEQLTVTYYDGTTSAVKSTREYVVYMPDSGLESEHTYKLTLTVTGKNGGVYTDSALLYIVKFYVNY